MQLLVLRFKSKLGVRTVLEAIPSLVDRLIQLLKEHQQENHRLSERLLSPLLADFDRVHEAYRRSFETYLSAIQDSDKGELTPSHTVFQQIRSDSAFAVGNLQRLRATASSLHHHKFDELVGCIDVYLVRSRTAVLDLVELGRLADKRTFVLNYHRSVVHNTLMGIANSEMNSEQKSREATGLLLLIVRLLEAEYARVHKHATELRVSLS